MARFPLTKRQHIVACGIQELTRLLGRPPTYRELQHELCFCNVGQVSRYITALLEKGWIHHQSPRHRFTVKLTHSVKLPTEGQVEITPAGLEFIKESSQ